MFFMLTSNTLCVQWPWTSVSLCVSTEYHSVYQKVKGLCQKEYRFSFKKCICSFNMEGYIPDSDLTSAHKLFAHADTFNLW